MTDIAAFVTTRATRSDARPAKTETIAKARPQRPWRIGVGFVIAALIGLGAVATPWTTMRPACSCALPPIHLEALPLAVVPSSDHPAQIKSLRP